jgi:hypothetical protein
LHFTLEEKKKRTPAQRDSVFEIESASLEERAAGLSGPLLGESASSRARCFCWKLALLRMAEPGRRLSELGQLLEEYQRRQPLPGIYAELLKGRNRRLTV